MIAEKSNIDIARAPLCTSLRTLSPARAALFSAMKDNENLGHENKGFLSSQNGFLPTHAPLEHFPTSHAYWDEVASELPQLYRSQRLRRRLDALPVLAADDSALDERYLLRASVVLSLLAHSYVRVEKKPPERLPDSIVEPWREITHRLRRPEPFLSYVDLIMYNWRRAAGQGVQDMAVENLKLLVPTVDNNEEQIFYLTQVEILARTAPLVSAVVAAQDAVLCGDDHGLAEQLSIIHQRLRYISDVTLKKINPCPRSAFYVDPVVWAKTVAPLAVPIKEGVQGPSGTSSPLFHLMDVFFQRGSYETILGREALAIRRWYPVHLRTFLEAVDQVCVPNYVARSGNLRLCDAYQAAFEAYAGANGFLGLHRSKVFGYLQTAFKVGRAVTIGGFQGLFEDRTWVEVDDELEKTRRERFAAPTLQ